MLIKLGPGSREIQIGQSRALLHCYWPMRREYLVIRPCFVLQQFERYVLHSPQQTMRKNSQIPSMKKYQNLTTGVNFYSNLRKEREKIKVKLNLHSKGKNCKNWIFIPSFPSKRDSFLYSLSFSQIRNKDKTKY